MRTLFVALSFVALANAACYEYSPAFPPPTYNVLDAGFQHALAEINNEFITTVSAAEYAAASYSIDITSSKEAIWSTHHTARERNLSRPDVPEVHGDALYRIASVTKTFTVLGLLIAHEEGKVRLDETVDQYLEELREEGAAGMKWGRITLRSLASQLSGIPRDFAQADLLNEGKGWPDPMRSGLPPMSREGLVACDEFSDNYMRPCKARDLLDTVRSQVPMFVPNQQSSYCNVAYELLGLVLERATGETFEWYIDQVIFKPLDMKNSRFSLPPDSTGVIPLKPHYWDVDTGVQKPSGGIYSTTNDLSKFLRYVLTHYNEISPTANWLHPASPSRGLNSFYGMPWEILRSNRVLKNSKRAVNFVTKAGGQPGYQSIIIVIPEYDLGITILVAGEQLLIEKLREIVTVRIVRAAEKLAIKQLQQEYAGVWVSTDSSLNSSVTIKAGERGLVVTEFISNGTDFFQSPVMEFLTPKQWYAQLVPTFQKDSKTEGEVWRMLVAEERGGDKSEVWEDFCGENIEGLLYGTVPVNKMVFWDRKGDKGAFTKLELAAFNTNLTRVKSESQGLASKELEEQLEL